MNFDTKEVEKKKTRFPANNSVAKLNIMKL